MRLESAGLAAGAPTREDALERVRRFAVLRAAHRALAPSSREALALADLEAFRGIRERLRDLVARLEEREAARAAGARGDAVWGDPGRDAEELLSLDDALDGFARLLRAKLDALPLSQLRASLSRETHEQRVEAMALLELCIESEPAPSRYLHVVDFILTLLCVTRRGGCWSVEIDPANLNEELRRRCQRSGECGLEVESQIVTRFQRAAERLAGAEDRDAVLAEMSEYKTRIASFFFVPEVLRCVVAYNAAARNYVEAQLRHNRDVDSAIDDEIGVFEGPEGATAAAPEVPPAHESPGVLAVQGAIRRRLAGAETVDGPAARIAQQLDLSWLEPSDQEAFLQSSEDGIMRTVRMTVVLGHLAVSLPECEADFAALGLQEAHLDTWICELGETVQREINELIQGNSYDGAVRLGDTKSRFLAAVRVVARRRLHPDRKRRSGADEPDTFRRDAIALVREHLERARRNRNRRPFEHLLGGGWRRTVALSAMGLLVCAIGLVQLQPAGPRATHEYSPRQTRDISPLLARAYRDFAAEDSVFIGTMSPEWLELPPEKREFVADKIRSHLVMNGVHEIMLFDEHRALLAHYANGRWRTTHGWKPRSQRR